MATVDIQYNKETNNIDVVVLHKRTAKVVGSFEKPSDSLKTAKFLTRVFSDITLDVMNECHEKAIKALRSM